MIAGTKAFAKRHWPRLRLRTILLLTLLFVAALPGVGAVFLRVYENTLVRQTEAELVAQGAALAATAQATWPNAPPAVFRLLRPQDYRPEPPGIDLNAARILPERPLPRDVAAPPDPRAEAAAHLLLPVITQTSRTTLASIVLLDRTGRIVRPGGSGSYANVEEVRSALGGHPETVLRHNGAYRARYAFEWLSRASDLRIHHARPIVVDGHVVGVLLLSRSPRALFRGMYEDRGKIAIGVLTIFATLVLLSGLLSRGIARPIEVLSGATREVAAGRGLVPDPPKTAAIEIQSLYADFASMAAAIELRSHYLRDVAHAVSHEFKTPLAGIRGAIELLQDHHTTMDEEDRQVFLANAAADTDRLSQLVTRLLDLARADMSRPDGEAESALPSIVARVADSMRRSDFTIEVEMAPELPSVGVPASTIETTLVGLLENSLQAGARKVTIAASRQSDQLVLDVADDGRGIAPADRARVFEPFFTSHRADGGTGLGLPIIRSLLEASHAAITLQQAERRTTFRVRFPVH